MHNDKTDFFKWGRKVFHYLFITSQTYPASPLNVRTDSIHLVDNVWKLPILSLKQKFLKIRCFI